MFLIKHLIIFVFKIKTSLNIEIDNKSVDQKPISIESQTIIQDLDTDVQYIEVNQNAQSGHNSVTNFHDKPFNFIVHQDSSCANIEDENFEVHSRNSYDQSLKNCEVFNLTRIANSTDPMESNSNSNRFIVEQRSQIYQTQGSKHQIYEQNSKTSVEIEQMPPETKDIGCTSKKISMISGVDECTVSAQNIISQNTMADEYSVYPSVASNSITNAKNRLHQKRKEKINADTDLKMRGVSKRKNSSTEKRKFFLLNQMLIYNDNFNFIQRISSFFDHSKNESADDNFYQTYSNLKTFLAEQINIMNIALVQDTIKNGKSRPTRNIDDISKLQYLCPFCSTHNLEEDDFFGMEKRLISEFTNIVVGPQLPKLMNKLFQQISKSFSEAFNPESLLSSGFFHKQRIILNDILTIIKNNRIVFGKLNRLIFLHIEYHKLFLNNIKMKLHYLPELQSIIFVLLRTSSSVHFTVKNQNFMILFYSFYSMNKFFDWIREYYEENGKNKDQLEFSSSMFVTHLISFVLRVCFVELIYSQLSVYVNAQMRYHFLCLNVFHDEILIHLKEKNQNYVVAMNSKRLLPFIIIIDKYTFKQDFIFLLEYDMHIIIKLDSMNISNFMVFLKYVGKLDIPDLNDHAKETNRFLESYVSFSSRK